MWLDKGFGLEYDMAFLLCYDMVLLYSCISILYDSVFDCFSHAGG